MLLNDASKATPHELSNVDGVPCGEVVEVVVPARDLEEGSERVGARVVGSIVQVMLLPIPFQTAEGSLSLT